MERPLRPLPAIAAALALLLAGLAGCGDDKKSSEPARTTTAAEAPGCKQVEAPSPKGEGKLRKPKTQLSRSKTFTATIVTNCGTIEITLDPKRAPKTGGSFAALAKGGFFDGTTFHRVAAGFVIQGGDPKGDGSGGPGYSVVEKPPSDLSYVRGVVAMAKTEIEKAGTSGSQFFVVTGEDAGLPPDYALLGKVTKGIDVADAIGAIPTNPPQDGAPTQPIVIEKITVAES